MSLLRLKDGTLVDEALTVRDSTKGTICIPHPLLDNIIVGAHTVVALPDQPEREGSVVRVVVRDGRDFIMRRSRFRDWWDVLGSEVRWPWARIAGEAETIEVLWTPPADWAPQEEVDE